VEALGPYGALFVAAFAAATILPFQSELVLVGLLAAGRGDPILLLIVGTIGNTAGSAVNWALGRGIDIVRNWRWLQVTREAYERAARVFRRYGVWSLLFAWLPFIGDALTVVAGAARVPFGRFVTLVAIGKAAGYAAIIAGLDWATA
jgi:membrane protein YqaA with SNARE-associated domain